MHKSAFPSAPRLRQKGFSLVEIALGLAILGILIAMTFRGQEVLEQYRQGQFINVVRVLESNLKAYKNTYGRWPGDCNKDGLLDHAFISLDAHESLDYSIPASWIAAENASSSYAPGMVCPTSTLEPFTNVNVVFNELKLGGITPSGEPNRKSASHTLGGFVYLGQFNINPDATIRIEDRFNAMVLTNVSIATARRLAIAIDGGNGSAANTHRVRRIDDQFSFAADWTASGETEDKRITVVVFFDRIPPV